MKNKFSITTMIILIILLCISSASPVHLSEKDDKEIFLIVHDDDLDSMRDVDILDVYGKYAVVETSNTEGLELFENPVKDKISIRGREIDLTKTKEGVNDNIEESHGTYIINLLGPVNPRWRRELEDKGVEIINYTPYYSFTVWMEHDNYEDVKDLYFVDWIGPYLDDYKINQEIDTDKITIDVVPGSVRDTYRKISSLEGIDPVKALHETNRIVTKICPHTSIEDIISLDEVLYVYPRNEDRGLNSELESQIIGGHWDEDSPSDPYRELGDYGAFVNQIGYTGKGVRVGLADTGLGDGTMGDAGHPDFEGRVIGGHSFAGDGDWSDGHGHGTHCTGSAVGNTYEGTGTIYQGHGPYYVSQGLAYDSEVYGQKVFSDGGAWIGPEEDFSILKEAKQNGDVYIHSNSWGYGYSGVYYSSDSDYDRGIRDSDPGSWGNEEMVAVVAAGNAGEDQMGNRMEQSIGSPGNSKNVITVGATGTYMPDSTDYGGSIDSVQPYNVTTWSSKGWTQDNRIKPDVVAPGRTVLSTSSPLSTGENVYSEDDRYEWMSGTSMSTPAVAGASSVVVEWYEDTYGEKPSPAMVKGLMINSARPLLNDLNADGDIDHIPNRDEGWGMVDIGSLISRGESTFLTDQSDTLTTGEVHEFELISDDPDQPVKFTLTWTDKYGQAYDNPSLKNDLDLEVISPSGDVYKGNAFEDGWTSANIDTISDFDHNGDGTDDVNTIENIFIHENEVEEGVYTVRVIGANIPEDALNKGTPVQDYALISHNTVYGSQGDVRLDREEYTTNDKINIRVNDGDLIGQHGVDVIITSDTQPEGMTVELTSDNDPWQFTGSILTSDSEGSETLKVSHGDYITVTYDDGEEVKEDSALIDGIPPSMTEVHVDSKLAVRIEWSTDEPSWGLVEYGDGNTISSPSFQSEHEVMINGLIPGEDYEFSIKSQDKAGNHLRYPSDDYLTFSVENIDDVEEGNIGWEPDENWLIGEDQGNSGENYWDCGDGDYGTYWDEKLISPSIDTSLWSEAELTWWHRYEFDYGYDGGVVEIFDGGEWSSITPEEGYDTYLDDDTENVLAGREAFTGDQEAWRMETVDLTPYVGAEDLRVRFWVGTDGYSNWPDPRIGWNIDDIGFHGETDTETFDIPLSSAGDGWNLVSTNILPEDTSLEHILENAEDGIPDSYEKAMYYDKETNGWSSYMPGRAEHFNGLNSWDHTMGLWIKMVEDDTLSINGIVPSNTEITLYPGWNLVGLPSETTGNHDLPSEISCIGYKEGDSYNDIIYDYHPEDFYFEPGSGYWVYNDAGYITYWNVEY